MNAQKLFSKKWIVFATAVLCTLLWGSAFPGIKTGYCMFRIASQDTADQLMFAGARFLIAGILTLLISFFVEKKEHKKKRSIKRNGESSGRKDRLYLWHLSRLLCSMFFIILAWRT